MITVIELKDVFDSISHADSYKRPLVQHPLEIYIGWNADEKSTLLLLCDKKPKHMLSSSTIEVRVGRRKDGKWAVSFSLADSKFFDIFCDFCCDLINSSSEIENKDTGNEFVCLRYNKWQEMLRKKKGILDEGVIKGLLGELFFLKSYLSPKYGLEDSIKAWIGPDQAKQDFVFADTWYEVKTTTSSSEKIHITSVAQLDALTAGKLVVICLDKTSPIDERGINLNSITREIMALIGEDISLQNRFNNELLGLGYYYQDEYNEHCYQFKSMALYDVDGGFPCIKRENLPLSVGEVNYELLLSQIREYKSEG